MKDTSGFARLRGLAAAGVVGVAGLLGGGSARAASTALGLSVTRASAAWNSIDNNTSFPSSFPVTTTNGQMYTKSPNPSAFGISDATLTAPIPVGDAFDNALILAVDGNLFVNPDGTVDLTGDTVTSDVVTNIVAGVDAQIRYFFSPTRPVVRALFSLTNTTGSPISVDPVVLGDYGSDVSTTVRATSDGDTTIEGADFWYITDEDSAGDPRITTTRYGVNACVVPFNALTPGGAAPETAVYGLRYPVTIEAGQTVRIMVFHELSDPRADPAGAIAAAADFESLAALEAAGLLTGLSPTEIGEIINYSPCPGVPGPVPVPAFSPWGVFTLFGVLGGLCFFKLRRREADTA